MMDSGPWARANKVQLDGTQGEGAVLNCPLEGNSHQRLVLGNTRWEYKNLN